MKRQKAVLLAENQTAGLADEDTNLVRLTGVLERTGELAIGKNLTASAPFRIEHDDNRGWQIAPPAASGTTQGGPGRYRSR